MQQQLDGTVGPGVRGATVADVRGLDFLDPLRGVPSASEQQAAALLKARESQRQYESAARARMFGSPRNAQRTYHDGATGHLKTGFGFETDLPVHERAPEPEPEPRAAEEEEGGRAAARVGAVREKRNHWRLEQALLVR